MEPISLRSSLNNCSNLPIGRFKSCLSERLAIFCCYRLKKVIDLQTKEQHTVFKFVAQRTVFFATPEAIFKQKEPFLTLLSQFQKP
jgi:hypothetical protein